MVYLEINKNNYNKGSPTLIDKINKCLINKHDKIFMLIYMEGCGPCNETRPEWSKLKNILSNDKENIIIVSIDKDLISKLKNIETQPSSFPTMRFITNAGENVENYEDSSISKKDRTIDSFVEWIKTKTGDKFITKSEKKPKFTKRRILSKKNKTKKKYYGGKWSLKYKRSINCNKPKGFSQKQYCKYSRK